MKQRDAIIAPWMLGLALCTGMVLLASPAVMTTLPNIYNLEQLEEFAAAPDKPDLTRDDLDRIRELQTVNFNVHEEHMRYKGTLHREGEPVIAPVYRYPGDDWEQFEKGELVSAG